MKIQPWAVAAVLAALSVGCTDGDPIVGVPEVLDPPEPSALVEEVRAFEDVSRVSLTNAGTLYIRQGSQTRLRVRTQQVALDHLATSVEDGALRIGFNGTFTLNEQLVMECFLTVETLEAIDVTGVWRVEASGLDRGPLAVAIDGISEMTLVELDVPELTLRHSGMGDVSASGSANSFFLELAGTASYGGRYLLTDEASVTIGGEGSATVAVRDALTANIEGGGFIYYFGDPVVTRIGTGSGGVVRLGS